ncbi:transposase [Flavobacterium lipolyticum]|uniref:Transposase n=1 Tax=Flavobacterium lipolyticum TaxID=2893754 RepID=A0ABS8M742_9FLAO|nr:transposase [Flavobacterium sp. F-126]MCC9020634.1 transposase [Flavobacterium sp. F-126]
MNKKRNFTAEFKLEQVLKYLENHLSYTAISNEAGIDHSVLRRWVSLYQSKGILGLEINKTKTTFSLDFKHKVVKGMIANNLSYFDTSIKFGIW